MATKPQPPEERRKAETKSQLLKKMAFAVQAKREGRLSAEDFKAMNEELRTSRMIRRPITIMDTDPYDSIITADSDETDMIHMYDTDLTDRFFR
jgi:hypothetical protein